MQLQLRPWMAVGCALVFALILIGWFRRAAETPVADMDHPMQFMDPAMRNPATLPDPSDRGGKQAGKDEK